MQKNGSSNDEALQAIAIANCATDDNIFRQRKDTLKIHALNTSGTVQTMFKQGENEDYDLVQGEIAWVSSRGQLQSGLDQRPIVFTSFNNVSVNSATVSAAVKDDNGAVVIGQAMVPAWRRYRALQKEYIPFGIVHSPLVEGISSGTTPKPGVAVLIQGTTSLTNTGSQQINFMQYVRATVPGKPLPNGMPTLSHEPTAVSTQARGNGISATKVVGILEPVEPGDVLTKVMRTILNENHTTVESLATWLNGGEIPKKIRDEIRVVFNYEMRNILGVATSTARPGERLGVHLMRGF